MSQATLLADAATIKNETIASANTATRVGEMLEDIINEAVPYKVYKALLTQTGTAAPVATVLVNTLGEVPTWAYDSLGFYNLSITGGFVLAKTFPNIGTSYNQTKNQPDFRTYVYTDNKIWIDSIVENLGSYSPADGVLYYTPITIEIYP